jgi:hypothetical protein
MPQDSGRKNLGGARISGNLNTDITGQIMYSLRLILLFANTDISTNKICLDTSILAKSIMGRREYEIFNLISNFKLENKCLKYFENNGRMRRKSWSQDFGNRVKYRGYRPVTRILSLSLTRTPC